MERVVFRVDHPFVSPGHPQSRALYAEAHVGARANLREHLDAQLRVFQSQLRRDYVMHHIFSDDAAVDLQFQVDEYAAFAVQIDRCQSQTKAPLVSPSLPSP